MGFKANFARGFNRLKYKTSKNAPTILFVAGLILDGIALYSAIKRSGKIRNILEEHNDKIDELHETPVMNEDIDEDYEGEIFESEDDKNKAIKHQYIVTTGKVAKEVVIPAGLWLGSKLCYFNCKNILDARYLGAVGVTEAVRSQFNEYRKRNIELNGAEADANCMYGEPTEIINQAPEEEGGEVTKMTVRFPENAINDVCTVWLDEESDLYTRDRTMNEFNARQQETWINRTCAANGFIDLYDILKSLGKETLLTGDQIILAKNLGKVYDDNKTEEENWISFGIDDPVNADKRNPILTLHISGMELLENVMPKHKQIGFHAHPLPFH